MQLEMLKSKIHLARVTEADLLYEGSLTIAEDLMEKANIIPHEKVQVANVENGNRFETYAIVGKRGTGVIGLNGAAARLGDVGDRIIIITYARMSPDEAKNYEPTIVILDENNKIKKKL